jgi:DNA recombination protein RmuC
MIQAESMNLKNSAGDTIRPDVIINLPEKKHIVIDSKVSLVSYEAYCNTTDLTEQDRHAKAHLESIKRHIDGLAAKSYHSSDQLITPDFVILFMPIEPAFALAFKYKSDLLQYAWDKSIALVSPTTLLTTLKTVATLWRQERQQQNALEIAKRGGALYDKFVGLVEDFEKLGEKIEAVSKHHQSVKNKLSSGSGNLIRQAEMLRELGAKTEKKLSKLESLSSPENV